MAKKLKYSAQKLTDEDKEILNQVVIKYAVKFCTLIQKYRNPKNYAEEVILKRMQSDEDFAELYTLTYVINYPSDHIFRPGQINEKLANDIRITIPQDYLKLESEENQAHHKGFLHPRDLRGVTKKLESQGIFIHLEGKEEIRRQEHCKTRRPGKKSSSYEVHDDHGGKQSAYKVTEEVEKLKRL